MLCTRQPYKERNNESMRQFTNDMSVISTNLWSIHCLDLLFYSHKGQRLHPAKHKIYVHQDYIEHCYVQSFVPSVMFKGYWRVTGLEGLFFDVEVFTTDDPYTKHTVFYKLTNEEERELERRFSLNDSFRRSQIYDYISSSWTHCSL
jgi:hypothetical protein